MRDSSHVPTPDILRMPCVHVAATKTLITDVDHSVADAWSKHPKGSAKHRSPIISNARYVSVYVVSRIEAMGHDLCRAYTNPRNPRVGSQLPLSRVWR
jgi:hypothetical protein